MACSAGEKRMNSQADQAYEPSFSVVVCTYNRADYLRECLRALDSLEYPSFEVVVVDGPSTDHIH